MEFMDNSEEIKSYSKPYLQQEDLIEKIKNSSFLERFSDEIFAQNWYAALCNNEYLVDGKWLYSTSWRSAGAIVAEIRNTFGFAKGEDYMDWYCSGYDHQKGFVPEVHITPEVKTCMKEIGFELL